MKVNNNFTLMISRILMVFITISAIVIQPLLDFDESKSLLNYDLVDLEEEPNQGEENNQEETFKDKKINSQFIGSSLNDLTKINKNISSYKECINSDSSLEIHIPPPDFL